MTGKAPHTKLNKGQTELVLSVIKAYEPGTNTANGYARHKPVDYANAVSELTQLLGMKESARKAAKVYAPIDLGSLPPRAIELLQSLLEGTLQTVTGQIDGLERMIRSASNGGRRKTAALENFQQQLGEIAASYHCYSAIYSVLLTAKYAQRVNGQNG